MDAFETYKHYLALKRHFTSKSYDFFKYNGAVKAGRTTFEARKDRYFFHKLSKQKNVTDFLLAIFVYGDKDMWVGDIVNNEESEQIYLKWRRVKESLTQTFKNDLDRLDDNLPMNFLPQDGQHPPLLRKLLSKEIHIETFIILNDLIRFSSLWNRKIEDTIIWPEVREKCKKYQPFLSYDKDKYKAILVDHFGVSM